MRLPARLLLLGLALLLPAAGDDVFGLNDQAKKALEIGHYDDAILLLEKARRLDAQNDVLRRNLGWAHFKRGKDLLDRGHVTQAAADLMRAVELDPSETGYALHLAQVHLRRFHLASSEATLRAALTHADDSAQAWLLLGDTLNLADRMDEAAPAYDQAVDLAEAAGDAKLAGFARESRARNARQLDVERNYQTDSTPSFVLRYPLDTGGPSFGVRLVNVLERARSDVGNALGIFPRQKITVVLYPPEEFKRATATHDWVGGLFDRKIRLPIADVVRDAPVIEATFRHEYTHLVVSTLDPRCASLINEGLAQVLETGRGQGLPRLVDHLDARPGGREALPEVLSLPRDFMELGDADQVRSAYLVSHAFVDHVVAHQGMAAVVRWIEAAREQPLDAAYRQATGRNLADEERMFRERVSRAP